MKDEHIRAISKQGGVIGVNFYYRQLTDERTAELDDVIRHIAHFIEIGGIDCVALGSDFDGIDCPLELEDADHMDRLIRALEQGGFTPRQIERVCWQNAWDFYERTL